ncbi:hypothetical protein TCAL_11617 [Tigriopus californicus]|uniref:Uncharacterized protein n=1 Tax=Tigriopus californicus TaxID=6832 RepID=A0A553NXU2_TIGCA|nr:hypothetical protein TCAL_11617 [Tigriopus californicus]|eukprot:TCALIF_11617-PA protein Name:"Similar to Wdr5b WD repeat-containing protein 5B (Mus musculus)" AED:0.38 eAED:0.40 QI:0/0/0/0.5/1/1/2/0/508
MEDKEIRKLRKKLRQIENLETQERELNDEEALKVKAKHSIRVKLAEFTMKRRSLENEETAQIKKACSEITPTKVDHLDQEEQLEIRHEDQENLVSSSNGEIIVTTNSHVKVEVSTPAKNGAKEKKYWRDHELRVSTMEGHEDLALVGDINIEAELFMTSSRDTTAIVWNMLDYTLLHSLRGHTSAVTGVAIMPNKSRQPSNFHGLTASLDCSIKVWNLNTGKILRNIYTYNSIKCLAFSPSQNLAITGTDGGKLEGFDVHTGKNKFSTRAHDDVVSTIDVQDDLIATGSRDGSIKVWNSSATPPTCLFTNDELVTASTDHESHLRCVSTLKLLPRGQQRLVFGDCGCNLKILDWRQGILHKIPNHTTQMGFTDSLTVTKKLLLASSYDLDTGLGHVNMFLIRNGGLPAYICSWTDEETSRIFGITADLNQPDSETGTISFVTCGKEVKLWQSILREQLPDEDCVLLIRPIGQNLEAGEEADRFSLMNPLIPLGGAQSCEDFVFMAETN